MIHFVGAGPGDPELLTRKGERLLRAAQVCVWAGSLVNPALLEFLPGECVAHDSASMDLEAIINVLAEAHRQGLPAVRLHTGDPSIYGAINEQMDRLDALGIPYQVVPGVSSFQGAAAALASELTAPEVSQAVLLTRVAGRTPMPAGQDLATLCAGKPTLCLFLSIDRCAEVCAQLAGIYGADCPAATVYRATWPDERILRGTLADLAAQVQAAGVTRQGLLLVGRALGRHAPVSKLYDAAFAHGWRAASDG